jgi:nitroimidazol reductase NimA-like FMN-containing flavoprotein (pyridoxamine 5'-phosphate oxidase superfamily)
MDARKVVEELEHPGARDLLTKASLARLAYNGQDGLPRVIPIGFLWTGEHVVICTATSAPKVRALSDRPDVALTIDIGDTPDGAKALLIRGRATVEIADGVPDEYLAQSSKGMADKLGDEGMAEFERQVRKMYEQMARIRIEPQWARFYDFGAGRLPSFLRELTDKAAGQ